MYIYISIATVVVMIRCESARKSLVALYHACAECSDIYLPVYSTYHPCRR